MMPAAHLRRPTVLPMPRDNRAAAELINICIMIALALPAMILAWHAPVTEEDIE
jgi:hypothetical protein